MPTWRKNFLFLTLLFAISIDLSKNEQITDLFGTFTNASIVNWFTSGLSTAYTTSRTSTCGTYSIIGGYKIMASNGKA